VYWYYSRSKIRPDLTWLEEFLSPYSDCLRLASGKSRDYSEPIKSAFSANFKQTGINHSINCRIWSISPVHILTWGRSGQIKLCNIQFIYSTRAYHRVTLRALNKERSWITRRRITWNLFSLTGFKFPGYQYLFNPWNKVTYNRFKIKDRFFFTQCRANIPKMQF